MSHGHGSHSHGHSTSHHGHGHGLSWKPSFSKSMAILLLAVVATRCLHGCATVNVAGQQSNRVEQIIRQYDAEIATSQGNPPITINNAFEAIRSTCRTSSELCRQSCALLPVVRQRINGWNDVQRQMWIPGTSAAQLEVTWEPDVDHICANVY